MYKDLNDASTCMTGNKRGKERTESYNMYKEKEKHRGRQGDNKQRERKTQTGRQTVRPVGQAERLADRQKTQQQTDRPTVVQNDSQGQANRPKAKQTRDIRMNLKVLVMISFIKHLQLGT